MGLEIFRHFVGFPQIDSLNQGMPMRYQEQVDAETVVTRVPQVIDALENALARPVTSEDEITTLFHAQIWDQESKTMIKQPFRTRLSNKVFLSNYLSALHAFRQGSDKLKDDYQVIEDMIRLSL